MIKKENSEWLGVDIPKSCANPRIPSRVVAILRKFREVLFFILFHFLFLFLFFF